MTGMSAYEKANVLVFHSHGVGQTVNLSALPSEGETVWATSWEIGNDGAKGSNVAVALANLEIPTAFAGRVGTDIWGGMGLDWLKKANVDLSHLIKDPTMATMIGMVMVDEEGRNSIILGGGTAGFTQEEIRSTIDECLGARFLITGFEIQNDDALSILRYGKQAGKFTILNPSPAPEAPLGELPFVDLLILNEPESERLLKLCGRPPDRDVGKRLFQLREGYACKTIILTLGSQGCALFDHGEVYHYPAQPVKAVDTSGAGDSFLAAVTAALVRGHSLQSACVFAGVYAAQTIQTPGTFPALSTLEQMKRSHEIFLSF
ncbi:MAG: ribokinase [Candidatus Pelethousia sp.]|nr:ribokinase [Candidatus Pelethousia sp.]